MPAKGTFGDLLERCVRSILADDSAGAVDVVVVDNGSTDGSAAALSTAVPQARAVAAPGNVGYARGANIGIATTDAAVVAVLAAVIVGIRAAHQQAKVRFAARVVALAAGLRIDEQ